MKNVVFKVALTFTCCMGLFTSPFAQATLNVDREFEFASGLVDMGFPDLANRVVNNVLRLHPDQQERATRIRGEILVAQRRFADAEALLEEMPEGHAQRYALQLRIANGFFRIGQVEDAQRLYDAFFDVYRDRVPTDPDLLRFYQDAAYQYGQMMERLGRRDVAVESYRRLLNAGVLEEGARRRLMSDVARMYLQIGRESSGAERSRALDEAFKMADEITWGGYDLWFGHAIGIMANVELARGNEDAARELIARYRRDLNRLDEILREQGIAAAASPVASVRFLLGELYEKEVHRLREREEPEDVVIPVIAQALTEYFNVFGRYGTSEWGAEAATRGRALIELLETAYGRRANIDFGDAAPDAAQAQFTMADDLFRQRQFARAVEEYLRILNAFPEGGPSVRALANVFLSYVNLDDQLHALMMAEYFADRFKNNETLGTAVLMGAREFAARDNNEMYERLFDLYFQGFPNHERAPQLLFEMARRRDEAGDRAGAMNYYQRIVDNFPRHRLFLRALMAMAMSAHQVEDFEKAAELFERFVAESQPGHERIRAQFLLADSHQRRGDHAKAIQAYGQLIRWQTAERPADNIDEEVTERNARLLERALFFVGFNFGRMTEPENQVDNFRQRAIAAYEQFLRRYPQSSLAPTAMRDKGAMQLARGDSTAAAATFELLAERYPDSEEGRSALFALVSSAFDIGEREIARDAFRRMIATPEAYRPEEFTRIGQLMLDNELYADVIPAYQRVVDTTEERAMLEVALFGLGTAHHRQGNHEQAVEVLRDLLERFPNTANFFDAQTLLARSSLEVGNYRAAQAALTEILRLAPDPVMNQQAQFDLGLVQERAGDKQAALASFQRIALLQDPNDRQLRPIIERSLMESLRLMMELELFNDVEDVSVQYLADFPQGEQIEEVRRIRADARRRSAQVQ